MGDPGYAEALHTLYQLQPRGVRMDLDRMREALALRGYPERTLRSVHIAGTNGKGSVAAMVESILRHAGYKTGLFTSPHLHRFVERIKIKGEPLSEAEAVSSLASISETLSQPSAPELTFFEYNTLLAFEKFLEQKVDMAVIEVGLGGRLDATNTLQNVDVSVITSIGLDHTAILGPTKSDIAREKAGILRPGVPVICGETDPESLGVIQTIADQIGSPVIMAEAFLSEASRFNLLLPGEHQKRNLTCALGVIDVLNDRGWFIPEKAISDGISSIKWPGRLEWLKDQTSTAVLLDAAHNAEGALMLRSYLDTLQPYQRRVLIFGAMADKPFEPMLQTLAPWFTDIIYTSANMPRSVQPAALSNIAKGHVANDPIQALTLAQSITTPQDLIVVCGSIFVMAQIRAQILNLPSDPPIAM